MSLSRLLLLLCCLPSLVSADQVRVAVAANFVATLETLADEFRAVSGHTLVIASGSTGKHYAQIRNGAAFDVFLAADTERPQRLEREGFGVAGSGFVYAEGRLALWLPGVDAIDDARRALGDPAITRIAIANPRLAPYGAAARGVLEAWGLWDRVQARLLRGENIAQAYQYVASGNAAAGLVALAQLRSARPPPRGAHVTLPPTLYPPIRQGALQLHDSAAGAEFLAFLRTERARRLIREAGYGAAEDR